MVYTLFTCNQNTFKFAYQNDNLNNQVFEISYDNSTNKKTTFVTTIDYIDYKDIVIQNAKKYTFIWKSMKCILDGEYHPSILPKNIIGECETSCYFSEKEIFMLTTLEADTKCSIQYYLHDTLFKHLKTKCLLRMTNHKIIDNEIINKDHVYIIIHNSIINEDQFKQEYCNILSFKNREQFKELPMDKFITFLKKSLKLYSDEYDFDPKEYVLYLMSHINEYKLYVLLKKHNYKTKINDVPIFKNKIRDLIFPLNKIIKPTAIKPKPKVIKSNFCIESGLFQ